jgi:hypothetical protein
MHIAKQAIEIERLNKENEKLRGGDLSLIFRDYIFSEVSRLKESPSLFSDADMNSAPNSPKAERREEDMKLRSQSDSQSFSSYRRYPHYSRKKAKTTRRATSQRTSMRCSDNLILTKLSDCVLRDGE